MPESKFISHQDKNGDLLIDKCETPLPGPEEQVCIDCVPNPLAVVTDWRNLNITSPRKNDKNCFYEVTAVTRYTDTGGGQVGDEEAATAALNERFEDYKGEVVASLIDFYSKSDSSESTQKISDSIEFADFDLDARPKSRLKLLYRIPVTIFDSIDSSEEDSDEDGDESGDIKVSYLASELVDMNIRVRKGLNLYNRHAKVSQVLNQQNLVYVADQKPFPLQTYGDAGFSRTSLMSRVVIELDQFLVSKGLNLPSVGRGALKQRVSKLKFVFNSKRKLKKLIVFTSSCIEKPVVFKGRKISHLNRKESFKDPTAMNYLSRMREMDTDLQARQPEKFTTFLINHTYPSIETAGLSVTAPVDGDQDAIIGCVADALQQEGKQLGQDILDEALSLGDVLAYQYHKNICKRSEIERQEEDAKMGLSYNPNVPIDGKLVRQMALEQAYGQIDTQNNVFIELCKEFLGGGDSVGDNADIRRLYDVSLNKMKLCGLYDFMIEGIQCLFKGLTLEQALSRAIQSALKAMSVENFGRLFVGLPLEKQQELDELVRTKITTGNVLGEQSAAQDFANVAATNPQGNAPETQKIIGRINFIPNKPWDDEDYIDRERLNMVNGPYEGTTPSKRMVSPGGDAVIRRSLGKDYDDPEAFALATPAVDAIESFKKESTQKLSNDQVMEAYLAALIEVYSDNLLELVDVLNKFPGAEIISRVMSLFDCPRPPLFTPSVMDFMKDIELPFCRNINDITLPRINNPLELINADLFKILMDAAYIAIQRILKNVLSLILAKICEIIGSAICKALETAGDIAAGLPELLTGRNTVKDLLRESICGPNADEATLDQTVVDLYKLLGGVGPEMANSQKVLAFNEAIASSVTRREMLEASLGEPSESFMQLVDSVVEFEFPELREAFPNRTSIGTFFQNIGNLMPADFRAQSRQFIDSLPEDDELPANPSLCATPQQIEEFCGLRSAILEGRASPQQIADLCRPPIEDFGDLTDMLQNGIPATLEASLPPVVSDPGCSNGLVPYEPDEQIKATSQTLGASLRELKVDFSNDMLGNGPMKRNWGFMNLVMSDTLGIPFTAHQRKTFSDPGRKQYVDFHVDGTKLDAASDEVSPANDFAELPNQKGAYPVLVAEWLTGSANGQLTSTPKVNNQKRQDKFFAATFDSINYGKKDTTLQIPDFGYRVEYEVDYGAQEVRFVEKQRKKTPDLSLSFNNNPDEEIKEDSYGFDLELFVADLDNDSNLPYDNARVKIVERTAEHGASKETREVSHEFIGKDDTLSNVEEGFLDNFPRFQRSLEQLGDTSPPIVLMSEMLNISDSDAELFWNNTTQELYSKFFDEIMNSESAAFKYGAKFENLTSESMAYGVKEGGTFTLYSDYEVEDEDGGSRQPRNSDGILGMSRDQFDNEIAGTPENTRVFYLDPSTFGGSYVKPAVHIKPQDADGWLGLVGVMFPELAPCKPHRTEVISFDEIEKRISQTYQNLSRDERLEGDVDCVTEVPYNRILTRAGKAGIEGVIRAACMIHVTMHFVKALATFSKFKPDFNKNFSDIYAAFIVEEMESGLKDAQASQFFEEFNPFKDEEFWYSFLEQAVQTYGRLVDEGTIEDPPEDVIEALIRLNNAQDSYYFPDKKDLSNAKRTGQVTIFKTLKNFRMEDTLEAVKETEDIAKIILAEFVKEAISDVSSNFEKALRDNKFIQDDYVENVAHYILDSGTGLTEGSLFNLRGTISEGTASIDPGPEYTGGGTFALVDGTPYVGYYHSIENDLGDLEYFTGDTPNEEARALRPFANNIIVTDGSGQGIGEASSTIPSATKPFGIRAYLKVDGDDGFPVDHIESIRDQDGNISDIYPGTLEVVTNPAGAVVGLKGELGLRYGLEFYAKIGNSMKSVTKVEIDLLDLPIKLAQPLQADSKQMLCLINNLLDDDAFKLFMNYCLPTTKLLSTIAIYNDYAFLDSIGEYVVEGASRNGGDTKPGIKISYPGGAQTPIEFERVDGWYPKLQRRRTFTPFVRTWDEWDKITLRRTNSQLKRMFKGYYNTRDFEDNDISDSVVATNINTLVERFKPSSAARLLPRWAKRRIRSNPFNSKGELCENNE